MTDRVLLLTPSCGLGGGIERYVATLEWSFSVQGVDYHRIDLRGSGAAAHLRMLAQARTHLRSRVTSVRIVLAHRALLPLASMVARDRRVTGISVVCHGSDVWGAPLRPRRYVEKILMSRSNVRVVAVSNFTAGVLTGSCQATVLPPGLSEDWYSELIDASNTIRTQVPEVELVTTFRLADWRDKGLPELLGAVSALSRSDVHVTVCGSGVPSADLMQLVRRYSWCHLRAGLTDGELARQLAVADLLVLATRTRRGRNASGEGFGLVLIEAQVAGTPVIGPAFGGSRDAYVDGVTGTSPVDETETALGATLNEVLQDPQRLKDMGKYAAEWSRECFAPSRYAGLAVARLL